MNHFTVVLIVCFVLISSVFEFNECKNSKSKSESQKNVASKVKKRSITTNIFSSKENGEENDDDDDALNLTQLSPNKSSKTSTKKKNSDFKLPDGYNRLQVPVLNKEQMLRKLFGDLADDMMENMSDESDEDESALAIKIKSYVPLRYIREVDEIEEEITVEMDFMVIWLDMFLCIANDCFHDTFLKDQKNIMDEMKSVDPIFLKRIWKPDLFIENVVEISRPELITTPIKLLFSPKGYILLQTRVTLKMGCDMKFQYYPADTQHCVFKIRSYSHTNKELKLVWDIEEPRHGVFLEDRGENNFDVKVDSVREYEKVEWVGLLHQNYSETYTILEFHVSCRRKLSYHLIQTYLPSVFFIIITWLCFLIPSSMVEARIGVSMTTLLTLTSMFSSVRESTPQVSYTKAIDIWMVACIFAVFLTLLEFTVLIWLRHRHKESSSEIETTAEKNGSHLNLQRFSNKRQDGKDELELENLEPLDSGSDKKRNLNSIVVGFIPGATQLNNKEKIADWIENHAFSIFSLLFFIFNVFYWSWLLHASNYFDWEVNPLYNADEE